MFGPREAVSPSTMSRISSGERGTLAPPAAVRGAHHFAREYRVKLRAHIIAPIESRKVIVRSVWILTPSTTALFGRAGEREGARVGDALQKMATDTREGDLA